MRILIRCWETCLLSLLLIVLLAVMTWQTAALHLTRTQLTSLSPKPLPGLSIVPLDTAGFVCEVESPLARRFASERYGAHICDPGDAIYPPNGGRWLVFPGSCTTGVNCPAPPVSTPNNFGEQKLEADLDTDGDGFSDLEERLAGTRADRDDQHPPLITRVRWVGVQRPSSNGSTETYRLTAAAAECLTVAGEHDSYTIEPYDRTTAEAAA